MCQFKLKNEDFGSFIQNSRNKLENNVCENDYSIIVLKSRSLLPSIVKNIIRSLDGLTQQDKIIWSKELDNSYKGIILDNCIFSDYKIFIEKWYYFPEKARNKTAQKFKISFIKGILSTERIEYISNLDEKSSFILNLFKTIDRKLIQNQN